MNKKIVITGGAGVMGKRLSQAFVKRGLTVRVLALPWDKSVENWLVDGIEIFYGDITDPQSLKGLCTDADTVYHMAGIILSPLEQGRFWRVNYAGTRNVLGEAARSGVSHFIYVSSASVNYQKKNSYANSKLAAEILIRNHTGMNYTIVRPTLAYEPGGSLEFKLFTDYLKKFPIIPFIGSGDARKSPVHVDDLIQGFVAIYGNKKSYKKMYNLAGGDSISIRKMAEMLLQHMGLPKPIISIPVPVCLTIAAFSQIFAKISGKAPFLTWQTISGIIQPADLDINRARRDLNYKPRTFKQGIESLEDLKDCLKK